MGSHKNLYFFTQNIATLSITIPKQMSSFATHYILAYAMHFGKEKCSGTLYCKNTSLVLSIGEFPFPIRLRTKLQEEKC